MPGVVELNQSNKKRNIDAKPTQRGRRFELTDAIFGVIIIFTPTLGSDHFSRRFGVGVGVGVGSWHPIT